MKQLAQQNQQLKAKLQEVVVRYKKLQKELTAAKTPRGDADAKDADAKDGSDQSDAIAKLTGEKHQAVNKLKEVVQKYKCV